MKKLIIAAVAASLLAGTAQAEEAGSPIDPVKTLFDGMRAGSSEQILSAFAEGATLGRFGPEGKRSPLTPVAKFAEAMGQYGDGEVDEQIFDVVVEEYETLASVWAPFTITVKGKLVGCGVNHFRLVRMSDGWKITDLVDYSKRPENCE